MDLIIVLAKAAADVFITGKSSGRTHSVCAQTFNHPASSRDRHTPNFRNREGLGSTWAILETCGDGGLALLRIMDEYVGFARSGMGRVSTAINACHSLLIFSSVSLSSSIVSVGDLALTHNRSMTIR